MQETQREMFSLGSVRANAVSQFLPPQECSLGSAYDVFAWKCVC